MKKLMIILSLFVFFAALQPAFVEAKMRIVVMDLKADGVPDRTARTVSNMLRTEFINLGVFTVVERAQMDAILKEQGVQQSGCTDQACAVQVGRLMAAKKILVGEVSPMGNSIIMTVRIVDVEKGVSEFAARQKAASEDVLDETVTAISEKLADKIQESADQEQEETPKVVKAEKKVKEAPEKPGQKSYTGYYLRGIVPGWGQFYSGHNIKGYVFMGTFAVTGILTFLAINNYNSKKDDYDSLGQGLPQKDYDDRYSEYKSAAGGATLFTSLFAITYIANWVDIIFFSKPDLSGQAGNTVVSPYFYTFNAVPVDIYGERRFDFSLGMRF